MIGLVPPAPLMPGKHNPVSTQHGAGQSCQQEQCQTSRAGLSLDMRVRGRPGSRRLGRGAGTPPPSAAGRGGGRAFRMLNNVARISRVFKPKFMAPTAKSEVKNNHSIARRRLSTDMIYMHADMTCNKGTHAAKSLDIFGFRELTNSKTCLFCSPSFPGSSE